MTRRLWILVFMMFNFVSWALIALLLKEGR